MTSPQTVETPELTTETLPEVRPAPVEVRPKTPQEVGEHAARYIEEHGWLQVGRAQLGGDQFATCALVACARVTSEYPGDAIGALAAVIGGAHSGDVYLWNDDPSRTRAEVLAALRSIR